MEAVAAFTDTYLPTVNGVTYTISGWRAGWRDRGGRMPVVYPRDAAHAPGADEFPVPSLPFPFYDGFRLGLPRVPAGLDDVDVVHVHSPFSLGYAGVRLARRRDRPLVASYHTPIAEYAGYLAPTDRIERGLRRVSERYERWFLGHADLVLTPSGVTRDRLDARGVDAPIEALPNGVDIDRFRPTETADFRERYGLDGPGPLVGYTGRHGYEKRLDALIDAAAGLDATVVLGGDGPARDALERRAARRDADVRFLGFLDRADLPAFYAALDVFAFPSPVETQGLVALEAMACGTPVVAVASGALAETVEDGVTGYHFPPGDIEAFHDAIERALRDGESLRSGCVDRREDLAVGRTLDRLGELYASL